MQHAHRLHLVIATAFALLAIAAPAAAKSSANNYFIFPVDVKHGTIRARGLLETGKVDMDGSVHVGYFYAVLPLGTPPRPFHAIVDTGSTVTYVPCSDCQHCGQHDEAPFNPSQSPTATWVSCQDKQCKTQSGVYFCDSTDTSFNQPDPNSGQCFYRISYAEQSSSEGKLVTDVFTFPNNVTRVPVTFGCENGETGEIFKQKPDGILGMGFSAGAFHSQLAAAGAIRPMFSLCFGFPSGGALLLGDAPVPMNPTYSWTALAASGWGGFYSVSVDAIEFDGAPLNIPSAAFTTGYRTVLDSGTTFIYLATAAYKPFADAATAAAARAKLTETTDGYGDICWSGAKPDFEDLNDIFPDVRIKFVDGGQLALPAYRYMFQLSRKGTYCLAVFDNGNSGSLIGGIATRNVLVKYDVESKRVGFADMDCHALGKLPAEQFESSATSGGEESSQVLLPAAAAAAATAGVQYQQQQQQSADAADESSNLEESSSDDDLEDYAAYEDGITDGQYDDTALYDYPLDLEEELEAVVEEATDVYNQAYEAAAGIFSSATELVKDVIQGTEKGLGNASSLNPAAAAAAVDAALPVAVDDSADVQEAAAASPAAADSDTDGSTLELDAGESEEAAAVATAGEPTAAAPAAADADADAGDSAAAAEAAEDALAAAEAAAADAKVAAQAAAAAASNAQAAAVAAADAQAAAAAKNPAGAGGGDGASIASDIVDTQSGLENQATISTTTAVSEDLLTDSTRYDDGSSSSSSSNSEASAAAASPEPEPPKVYWGAPSPGFSNVTANITVANITAEIKHLVGGRINNPNTVVVIVVCAVLGGMLLTAAGFVAYAVRRRQIKALGFSRVSGTDVDCELAELAGIRRFNPDLANHNSGSAGGSGRSGGGSNGWHSGTQVAKNNIYNSNDSSVRGDDRTRLLSNGATSSADGLSIAGSGAAAARTRGAAAAAAGGLGEMYSLDLDQIGSTTPPTDLDAIKSPGRDQQFPKPLLETTGSSSSSRGDYGALLPPPAQQAAAAGGRGALPPPPRRQQQQQQRETSAAATGVVLSSSNRGES